MSKRHFMFFLVEEVDRQQLEELGVDVNELVEDMETDETVVSTARGIRLGMVAIAEDIDADFGGRSLKDLFIPDEPVGYDEDYLSEPKEDEYPDEWEYPDERSDDEDEGEYPDGWDEYRSEEDCESYCSESEKDEDKVEE